MRRSAVIEIPQKFLAGSLTRPWSRNSPISCGTTVPLTHTVPKPILHGIEHCPTHRGRRKLIERMGREGVYRFETDSQPELLDIGDLSYRLSPGLVRSSEAQCHVNSWLFSSSCSYWSGQWV